MYEKRGIFNEKNYFLDNDLLSNHVYSVIFFKKLKNAAQTIITSCFFPRIGQWLFIFITLQLRPTACKAHLLVQLPDLKPFVRLPEKYPKAIILISQIRLKIQTSLVEFENSFYHGNTEAFTISWKGSLDEVLCSVELPLKFCPFQFPQTKVTAVWPKSLLKHSTDVEQVPYFLTCYVFLHS